MGGVFSQVGRNVRKGWHTAWAPHSVWQQRVQTQHWQSARRRVDTLTTDKLFSVLVTFLGWSPFSGLVTIFRAGHRSKLFTVFRTGSIVYQRSFNCLPAQAQLFRKPINCLRMSVDCLSTQLFAKPGSTVYQSRVNRRVNCFQSRLNCLWVVIQLIMDAQSPVDEQRLNCLRTLIQLCMKTCYQRRLQCLPSLGQPVKHAHLMASETLRKKTS